MMTFNKVSECLSFSKLIKRPETLPSAWWCALLSRTFPPPEPHFIWHAAYGPTAVFFFLFFFWMCSQQVPNKVEHVDSQTKAASAHHLIKVKTSRLINVRKVHCATGRDVSLSRSVFIDNKITCWRAEGNPRVCLYWFNISVFLLLCNLSRSGHVLFIFHVIVIPQSAPAHSFR